MSNPTVSRRYLTQAIQLTRTITSPVQKDQCITRAVREMSSCALAVAGSTALLAGRVPGLRFTPVGLRMRLSVLAVALNQVLSKSIIKRRCTMIIYYTPEQYQSNDEFRALISMLIDNGGNPQWNNDGTTSVYIGDVGMGYVEQSAIQLCLDMGIRLESAKLYSPVIPKTTLDNKVPSSWPNAYKSDPDDPDKQITKEWQEYTHVLEVDGGYVLRFCEGGMNANRNLTWACSNEALLRWIDEFSGFTAPSVYEQIKIVEEADP